jgi:MFS family permease
MSQIAVLKDEVARLQGDGRGKALVVIAGGSSLIIGVLTIYPVLLPELRGAYGLDLSTGGMLLSVLWFAYAGGQIIGGLLADHIGEMRTLVLGTGVPAVALVSIIVLPSVLVLFAMTALLGWGLGIYSLARYTVLEDLFSDRVGTTVEMVLSAADAGQVVFPPLVSVVAVATVWQFGFGLTVPLFFLIVPLLWLYVPTQPTTGLDAIKATSFADFRGILSDLWTQTIRYGTVILMTYMCIWVAFTSLYPTYLVEHKGLSPTMGAVLFGLFFGQRLSA